LTELTDVERAKWARETLVCREIVDMIRDFGVDRFRILKIVELLGLELESAEEMRSVSGLARGLLEGDSESKPENSLILP
jgi:hypothetical protein